LLEQIFTNANSFAKNLLLMTFDGIGDELQH